MIFYNGANGSLGRYFSDGARMAGVSATAIQARLGNIAGLLRELELHSAVDEATLILFAAKVSVPWCEANPEEARKTNVDETISTATSFIRWAKDGKRSLKLIYVSSAHLYARNDNRIHETDPVLPRSVYARTKREAEIALQKICDTENVDLRIARVFGLVAPRQPENYILHAMLKRVREKRLKEIPGLSGVRDYLDSRDVVRSLIKLIKLSPDHFSRVCPDRILNICSGKGISIRDLAKACIDASYPAKEAETLARDLSEAPPRADDVPRIVGSNERYRALFGENSRVIALEATIADALKTPSTPA